MDCFFAEQRENGRRSMMPIKNDAVNILVVDDLPEKLLTLEIVLEELGENVVTARSGAEALRRLLEQEFAVILLDVNMPDMDGFETAMMIRRHKKFAQTPIIFITGLVDEILTNKAYSLGAVDYILSPVVPEILRTKVRVFVELFRKTEQIKRHAEERVALAHEQAARVSAEAENRRKDEFLAILSHELRNPLAPIRNALQILSTGALEDPELAEARDVMLRQVHQLASMVDDLLDVFKITHHKISLSKEHVELTRAIRLMTEDHRSGLEGAGLRLRLELPDEPVWVLGDRVRLAQVVTNLLHNAAKFTNPGDQITVHLEADRDRQRAALTVRDTGIGIAPEHLPHIFDSFNQADRGLERERGGLGLGLALVRGFVELHGGRVQAESAGLGQGAELTISLPLSKEPKSPVRTLPNVVSISTGTHLRILIVEDNRDTAKTLLVLLKRYGHEVIMVHSGLSGVETARQWRPDVVLCDLGLPELDGYEVARTLRHDPVTAGARLIAVSGYGQEEDRLRSNQAGFDLHLTKPVDPLELQQLLSVMKVGP
jgi:signal transduction histidine kinase